MAFTWERSVSATTLGSDGDTITVSSIPVKRLLHVEAYLKSTNNIESVIQFNADTGSNYWKRLNNNGSTTSSSSAGTGIDTNLSSAGEQFISFDVINIAGKEKLVTGTITDSGGTGEANSPNCVQLTGVWTNTSDAITSVRIFNNESGDFTAGSILTVWDGTTTNPSLPNGTIFEVSDTGKHWMWDGTSAWNEVT